MCALPRMASPLARASKQEYNKCRAAGELPAHAKASMEFKQWSKAGPGRADEFNSSMGGRQRAPTAATPEDRPVGSVSAENFMGRPELCSKVAARVGWPRRASNREALVVGVEKDESNDMAERGSGKAGIGSWYLNDPSAPVHHSDGKAILAIRMLWSCL